LLARAVGDRDPPRSLEQRVTISCHAPLSDIDYLSIDHMVDTLRVQSCQPLSIDRMNTPRRRRSPRNHDIHRTVGSRPVALTRLGFFGKGCLRDERRGGRKSGFGGVRCTSSQR
jgi:hypothetical protein